MSAAAGIILSADDFALTEGVSRGIGELALAGRLSAASALVTTRHWPAHASQLKTLVSSIAVGLHVNLTLGAPLGPMPKLCPAGQFPSIGRVLSRVFLRRIDVAELTAEIGRQLTAFAHAMGAAPDFIDGHQHVHALPIVRTALLAAIRTKAWTVPPLIRVPADGLRTIRARGAAVAKSLLLSGLSFGFGAGVRAAGFPANDGFSGVSAFDETKPYTTELERFFTHPGRRHLVMCHPGHVDAELPALDSVVGRRAQEFEALMAYPHLPSLLWHPERTSSGAIDWSGWGHAHG